MPTSPSGAAPADGYLLLHVWLESAAEEPLRVRVTAVPGLSDSGMQVAATASVDGAVNCVREWLTRFVASNIAAASKEIR